MNPQSPREELEIRITALLMGELPPDEAAALQTQIAADAELNALHARLQRALGLLREASTAQEPHALQPPMHLSDERRARLFAHFKGESKPGPVIVKPRRDWKWAVPLGLAASLMALIGGAMFVNGFALRKGSAIRETADFTDRDGDVLSMKAESAGLGGNADEKRRAGSRLYRSVDELSADRLADSATSAVKSQIASASNDRNGSRTTWNAQPGMLRVDDASKVTRNDRSPDGAFAGRGDAGNAMPDPAQDSAPSATAAHSRLPALNLADRPGIAAGGPAGTGGVYLPPAADKTVADFDAGIGNFSDGAGAGAGVSDPFATAGLATAKYDRVPSSEPSAPRGGAVNADSDKPVSGGDPGFFAGSFWDTPRVQTQLDRGTTDASNVAGYRGGLASSQPVANDSQRAPSKAGTSDLNGFSSTIGSVSGAGGVTKTGSGTLTLSSANAYSGGTTIAAGTLQTQTAGGGGAGSKPAAQPADTSAPARPTTADHFASYKTEGESRDALGTAHRDLGVVELKGGTTFNMRIQPAKDPVSGEERPIAQESLDLAVKDLRDRVDKLASPSKPSTTSLGLALGGLVDVDASAMPERARGKGDTTRGEISEKLDAASSIEGVKGDTNGRAATHDFDFQAGTAFGITKFALGDQPASAASGLGSEHKLGDIRVDYGMPLKETDGQSPRDGKFQFNVGYQFGNETSEDGRKTVIDPQATEFEGSLSYGGAIAGKPAAAPAEPQPAVAGESGDRTRWLEVTRNGTIANPAANATDGARRIEEEPVVGRIAFWNDDDTAKVNMNTAGGFVESKGAAQWQTQPRLFSDMNAPADIPQARSDFGTISGVVTGSGTVTLNKAGAGNSQLDTASTFTGTTTVNGGTLILKNKGAAINSEKLYAMTPRLMPGGSLFTDAASTNALTFGGTGTTNETFAGVTTKGGGRASGEVKPEFNAPAELPAPEIPRMTGAIGTGTVQLRDSGTQAVAERELARRMSRETAGRNETAAGQAALQKKDYESAFAHFKNAAESLPAGAPNVAESRKKAEEGIAAAGVRLAEQRVAEGYSASAVQTLHEVLKQQPDSPKVLRLLSQIEAPDYFNKQVTPQHAAKVEDVKEAFVEAKGFTDLGRYDLADRKYQEVLAKDPYNTAAQNGREEIAMLKDRSARAAYNTSRAISTPEVDQAWARPHRRSDRQAKDGKDDAAKGQPMPSEALSVADPFAAADVEAKLPQALQKFQDGETDELRAKSDRPNIDVISSTAPGSSFKLAPAKELKRTIPPPSTPNNPEYAIKVDGKPGFVKSPYDTQGRLVDVRGLPPGTEAECPYSRRTFLVPEATERLEKKLAETGAVEAKKVAEQIRDPEPAAPKPAPNPLVPQPEIRTDANAFSTFSLNVSDVAFKLAAASLERGVMPDVSTLRSEEFINAFDYRDPEARAGAPLAFASERARYPFAQNRDLLRLSVKTAAAGRAPGKPLNIVLLLDNSGSMERADRVRTLREAMRVLSAQLQPQDKLSIVTFARTPRLWADGVSGDKAGEVTARVGEITPEGGTNLAAALDLGYATALKHYQPGSVNHVVVLTDGAANLGDVDPAALKQKVEAHRKQGVALDCFGIGWEGLNDDMLEQLSRNGDGRYGFINTPEEAATNFAAQLAGALRVAASDVKVQVEWNPKRVTAYRQVGYAKHQLTKEQFRDNTVDAAELAAAESGNALYVVEVNPRGTGDLAIVRVRFKMPGTSDYREHEWTVPFGGNAAPLEQSSSTLRLAATASAFSEMLASSPFAMEVTSDRLLSLLNGVPAIYGADARPKKLEWMIRQAKSLSGR